MTENQRFKVAVIMICFAIILTFVIVRIVQGNEEEITEETVTIEPTVKVKENYTAPTVEMSETDLISKVVWGEARGCSKEQQAAVVWCILNRYDAGFGTIEEIVTASGQFYGWNIHNPVINSIKEVVIDVLTRYEMEKVCVGDVGRVLPKDYLWFKGNGEVNIFRNDYNDLSSVWNWEYPSPYGD